jgi:HAD superfamily hydrolase (TIGR01549 family)
LSAPAPAPLPEPLRAALFDWDGTLVDSAESSFRCYARVFPEFGIPFDRAAFERTYSPDWYHTYRQVGLPEEHWDAANARWLEHYACEPPLAIEDALEGLRRLREAGVRLGLVTSGSPQRVRREMSALGVDGWFEAALCAGDYTHRKPHPEPLLRALERMGLAAADCVYIGDSPEDVEMSRAAGVYAVGIPGAFPNRELLRASAPELLAPSLRAAVDALLAGLGPARQA